MASKRSLLARALAAKTETTISAPKAVEWFTATLSSDTQYFDMRIRWALVYLCLAAPVVFDEPGLVVLGRNIHDTMAAWYPGPVLAPVVSEVRVADEVRLDVSASPAQPAHP